ncbi:hypothetical protein ASG94_08825 [Nocardioides sp. Soil805]|nr:hypothetical protein ASG94_08825 [Nocardioides sp. Soil805]
MTWTEGSGFRRHVARGAGAVWVGASAFVLAVGVAAATFLLGWLASAGLFLLVMVSGWLWTGLRWLLEEDPGRFRLGSVGLVAPTFVVGGIGLLGMLGLGAVPVVAVLVLLHPDVRRRVRALVGPERLARVTPTRLRTDPSRPPSPRAPAAGEVEEPVLEVTDELTDADLCEAWRSSYVALQRARTDASRFRAVEMRVIYLDDLERRLGDDFARWMESLPRAAEDPRRFLRDQEPNG